MRRSRHQGFSLVEIMISLVIGLVVIGAVFSNYLASVRSQGTGAALGQMAEDAGTAFTLMRRHVSMAGYSRATGYSGTGLARAYNGPGLFGCNASFTANNVGVISGLTCAAAAAGLPAQAVAVAYEADATNSLPTAGGAPRDVVGNALVLNAANNPTYLSEARFYVNNGALLAQGNGAGAGTAAGATEDEAEVTGSVLPTAGSTLKASPARLVENIVAMRIKYGLSSTDAATGRPGRQIERYVNADTVSTSPTNAAWQNVRSVRICLVVRSEASILDETTPYYGCDAAMGDSDSTTSPTAGDRRLYRAFTSTIMLQN